MDKRYQLVNPYDHETGVRLLTDTRRMTVLQRYTQEQREEAEKECDRLNDEYQLLIKMRATHIRNAQES